MQHREETTMRVFWRAFIAVLAFVAARSPTLADDSWVGKKVMPKKADIQIGYTDDNDKIVNACRITDPILTVLGDKDDFIKVNQNRTDGWFEKKDAVLLSEAVAYFADRIQKDAKDAFAYGSRGVVLQEQGDADAALKDYAEAIHLQPESPTWHIYRGTLYQGKNDIKKAIADFDEAVRLKPKQALGYCWRADAYRSSGDLDHAMADYTKAIMLDSEDPDSLNARGEIYEAKKEYDSAIKDFTAAIKLDRKFAGAYNNRGIVYKKTKEYKRALADYRTALKLDPKSDGALNNLAYLMAACPDEKVRDGKKAIEYATKACERADWKRWEMLDTLAIANAEAGNFTEATRLEKKAMELGVPDKPDQEALTERLKLFEASKPYHEPP
jgi:tetratricopeptide (TPR) repeat protein